MKWQDRALQIHHRFLALAQSRGNLTSDREIIHYLALSLAGEVGELANLMKKSWEGLISQEDFLPKICSEMADVMIYLEHLCCYLDVNLSRACSEKLLEVESRISKLEQEQGSIAHPPS